MFGDQGVDDFAQGFTFHDLGQLVEREIDAVVGHAALRKIVGADAFGAVAGADLAAALGGTGGVLLLPLEVIESRTKYGERLGAIAMLRTVLLHHHHDPGGNVRHAHRGLGLVDVLAAGAAGAQRVDAQVRVVDGDVDIPRLGQQGDGGGRGMDAAGGLGVGHALHAVYARFEFELGKGAAAADFGDDF